MNKKLVSLIGVVGLTSLLWGCTAENPDVKETPEETEKIQKETVKIPEPEVEFNDVQNEIYNVLKESIKEEVYSPMSLLGAVMNNGKNQNNSFEEADVSFVIATLNIDWQVQAEVTALNYVNNGSISEYALFEQLVFEQFTEEEAIKAIKNIKVDWELEAVERVNELKGSMSDEEIIKQLINVEQHLEEHVMSALNK